jgi:hypothetical protein
MKIGDFFSFISSLNQKFPHIPYVASKNELRAKNKIRLSRGVAGGFGRNFRRSRVEC